MSFSRVSYPEDKAERYEVLLAQAVALLDDTLNPIANLANIATSMTRSVQSTGAVFT